MADSGSIYRLGFGIQNAFPAVPAAGPTTAPSSNVGEYGNFQLSLTAIGNGGNVTYLHPVYSGSINYTTRYYKMRGMDKNTNGLYDTWITTGVPDFSGSLYTGALTTPLRDVIIQDSWMFPAAP